MKQEQLQSARSRLAPRRASPLTWPLIGLGVAALAAALVLLSASAPRRAALFTMPDPLMLVPPLLLLALAVGMRAWPAAQPAPRRASARPPTDAAAPAAALDWPSFAALAMRFFGDRRLVCEDRNGPWKEAADLMLRTGSRTYLVHARHWQAARVDAAAVRALAREVEQRHAAGGILLCARDVFTPEAARVARQGSILLLDPSRMVCRAAAPGPTPAECAETLPPLQTADAAPGPAKAPALAPRQLPVLRPDQALPVRSGFQPTKPMGASDWAVLDRPAASALPVLRPDHLLMPRGDFQPTEPLVRGRPTAA